MKAMDAVGDAGSKNGLLPPGTEVNTGAGKQTIEGPGEQPPENHAQPREVEVHFLEARRAGRSFPCLRGNTYAGCIGYDRCKVLCWSPRLRERQALVRVDKPTGGPCRDCVYAREVLGEVATLNGRQVRLIECRLGFWYGRTTVSDFVDGKIALNVQLPCPGFVETDLPHPAVARMRETARRRMRRSQHKQDADKARQAKQHHPAAALRP